MASAWEKKKHETKQDNQQVTKRFNFLVGTSETTRPLSSKQGFANNDESWNEWLAGLIDGSLLLSKSGYPSCEITMSLQDEHALAIIKQKLGGSIKLRSAAKALRYRLPAIRSMADKKGMIELINRINGKVRHTSRVKQLESICCNLNIRIIYPTAITKNNGWFYGFFYADGTITYSIKNNQPQLTISVTNKLLVDVITFKDVFGGNVYFDKGQNGYYKWSIQSKHDIELFKSYLLIYPSYSDKKQILLLTDKYYQLKALKAYSALSGNSLAKAWTKFNNKWNNRG